MVAFADAGYTVQKHVLVATWWLHRAQKEKAHYLLNSGLSFVYLVPER
jgi:hypothetical protein